MMVRQQTAREAYSDRNETLRLLGFQSYGSYTRSKLWKIIRERALDLNGRVCRKCKGTATQVHHGVYTRDTLTGEDVRGLVPVCGFCHRLGSTTPRGSKSRRVDRLRVRHLSDTNAFLMKHKPRPERHGASWCECGQMRKHTHKRCRRCERAKG